MKKLLAVLSIFLAMLAAVSMAVPVAADDPTPTGTPEPPAQMHVVVTYGSYVVGATSASIQCSTIEGGHYEITGGGYLDFPRVEFDSSSFTCLGEVVWPTTYQWPTGDRASGEIEILVTSAAEIFYNADFQQTDGAVPYRTGFINTEGQTTSGSVDHGGSGDMWNAGALTQYIFVHDETEPPCGNDWEAIDIVAQGDIDATLEDGVAETLTPSSFYRLTVYGGPWNDSLTDRYDTAVRTGGESGTWWPLDEYFNLTGRCTETDPLDPNRQIILFQAVVADFAIRVNDIADFFDDNTGAMSFRLEKVQPESGGCEGQYLEGSLITSGTIPATSSAGVSPDLGPRLAGSWIEIVTSGGPWLNDGTGGNRYDIALNNTGSTWEELSGSSYAACTTTDGDYITAYVQLATNNGIKLRVNDTSAWTGNTGSMGYAIYAVTYTPRAPTGCAEYYHLGSLIKTIRAPGAAQLGEPAGTVYIGQDVGAEEIDTTSYIAIETDGLWLNGATPDSAGAIAASTDMPATGDFENLQTYSEVTCAVPIDPVGHIRVYIPLGPNIDNYWLRTQDFAGNWGDNSGYMNFKIYAATLLRPEDYTPGTMPGAGICDGIYTKGAAGDTYTLYGNYSDWVNLPALTPGKIYALETSAGPWINNAVNSYEVQISDGITEYNLVAFAGASCAQSADELHLLLYFQALAGRHYKLRVYDPGGNFTDNADTIDVIKYDNVTNVIVPPPSCTDNYTLTQMGVYDNRIPRNPSGVEIDAVGIGSDEMYAIEINETDYWYYLSTPEDHRFDAEITTDNGSHWEDFDGSWSGSVCARQLNISSPAYGRRYRIYFTAPDSGVLKMRATDDILLTDGHLTYTLYGATQITDTPPPGPIVPPAWNAECYERFLRPSGLFKMVGLSLGSINFGSLGTVTFPTVSLPLPAVDDWVSFLQWTVRSYFAWCPYHTAALMAIPTSMDGYEPFGTIAEVQTSMDHINKVLDDLQAVGGEGASFAPHSYVFNSGAGGETGESFPGLFQAPGDDSPWAWDGGVSTVHTGEDITFSMSDTTPLGGETDYVNYCKSIFDMHFGVAVGGAMCAITNLLRTVPMIWILVQLAWDIGSVVGIVKYIQKRWINPKMSA
jgi:hypothetical protein